jgi:hypothetical protein
MNTTVVLHWTPWPRRGQVRISALPLSVPRAGTQHIRLTCALEFTGMQDNLTFEVFLLLLSHPIAMGTKEVKKGKGFS